MTESSAASKQFAIQKLYLKDASFESPDSPHSFSFSKWDPKIELNMTNTSGHIDGDIYEAVLRVTATVGLEDRTACLIEVQFAGLFAISGFDEDERKYLLGSQCMTVLFPYVREVISDMTIRGGFPPFLLSPVNFDGLYQQHLQQQKEKQADAETAH